jgi:aminoglycoside phosphotransferase (APT) family kinase protein
MTTQGVRPLDLPAIATFLMERGVDVAGELTAELIVGGRSNLTYMISDGPHRWVVRRPPVGATIPSAHDVVREYRVTRALETTGVPVARTVALCEDSAVIGSPFTVVEHVDGATFRTQAELAALDDDQVLACVDGLVIALARLHRVDHRAVGLETFGRADEYGARQLRRWAGQWDLTVHDPVPEAGALRDRLQARVPEQGRTTIVHGDYRIDNTLVDRRQPGIVRAIVDWELSTIGDPVADVAMMCAYRHPALNLVLGTTAAWTSDRLPSPESIAERYEAVTDVRLDHWDFYLALAYYKLAVIAQGIHHRYQAGVTLGDGFDTAGDSVAAFLTAGLDQL